MKENNYDDIINLSRPVSRRHIPMSMIDRAAQFSAFAALTGFDADIDEAGKDSLAKTENEILRVMQEQMPD